jgi:DNA invertase Pin-like site-specific DNA recombinase
MSSNRQQRFTDLRLRGGRGHHLPIPNHLSSPLWQDGGASDMHIERKPKAYSYTRFSTPEQAKGDSSTRQALAAERWAKQNSVELDTELTFRDEGVSAFDGLNVERGALGAFLRAVQNGDVPKGSWLLVENLDRISRQKPRRAARLMEDIIEAGVTVVDLHDGSQYSAQALDEDSLLLIGMVFRFIRANEESELKASRVAAARLRAREQFASDQPLTKAYTKQLPGWLCWNDDTKQIEAIPERADVAEEGFVRSIRGIIDEAPRGKDTAELEQQIAKADVEADVLFDMAQELLAISIEEKSAAARKSLSEREAALADAEERVRRLRERRDKLATASVRRRLSAIEQALTERPLDVHKANAALREAAERMIIFPAEGRIEIYWRHADEPQDAPLHTRKFDWTGESLARAQSERSQEQVRNGNTNTEAT